MKSHRHFTGKTMRSRQAGGQLIWKSFGSAKGENGGRARAHRISFIGTDKRPNLRASLREAVSRRKEAVAAKSGPESNCRETGQPRRGDIEKTGGTKEKNQNERRKKKPKNKRTGDFLSKRAPSDV